MIRMLAPALLTLIVLLVPRTSDAQDELSQSGSTCRLQDIARSQGTKLDLVGCAYETTLSIPNAAASDLDLRRLKVNGDLIITGVPRTLDLRDSEVAGTIWIDDGDDLSLASDREVVVDGYTNESVEGCWEHEPRGVIEDLLLERTRARALYARRLRIKQFRAHGMDLTFGLRIDFSHFDRRVDLSMSKSRFIEAVATRFEEGLVLAGSAIEGNLDLACAVVGGDGIDGLALSVGGFAQLVGIKNRPGDEPALDFALSRFGALFLRGVTGKYELINLAGSKIGTLDLDYDRDHVHHPSLNAPWRFNRVNTKGLTVDIVSPSLDVCWAECRSLAFLQSAQLLDRDAARRFALAFQSAGDYDAADDAWQRHTWMTWLGHAPVGYALGFAVAMVVVAAISLRARFRSVRGFGYVEAFSLAFDLFTPDLVSLGARERYENRLKRLRGCRGALLYTYRFVGWVVVAIAIAQIVVRAGR